MERQPSQLADTEYDVLVIGGGIFGLCAAYDAAQRGLSVALIEKGDFAHATSANSFKMVHGGIRYLQHADIWRLRESSAERRAFLRIAPHLVEPLPILIPTYGHAAKGKAALAAGFALYDLLTFDRNQGISDRYRRIPRGRLLSTADVLQLFPDLPVGGLTGGGVFHDGQMYNPTRLALAFLLGAVRHGARAANYVEATGFLTRGDRVLGVRAIDRATGDPLEVRAKVTVNATGSWAERLNSTLGARQRADRPTFSRDACFVVGRRLFEHRFALAIPARTRDPDAIVSRSARHLFVVPWREYTLVGVWHKVHRGSPDHVSLTVAEVESFIDEINWAYPALELSLNDVSMVNFGLVLFGENDPHAVDLRYGKRSELVDHAYQDRVEGLISLVGIRYTTARALAEKAVELVFRKLGWEAPRCRTGISALPGGKIENVSSFPETVRSGAMGFSEALAQRIARNYGSEYRQLVDDGGDDPWWLKTLPGSQVMRAEVRHAVRREMAIRLSDIVFRRTDLGTAGHPGPEGLRSCAELAGRLLGWSHETTEREIADIEGYFPPAILASASVAEVRPTRDVTSPTADKRPLPSPRGQR